MKPQELGTAAANTWCPGCGNFAILNAFKSVAAGLSAEGIPPEKMMLVAGIGCHGKIADYLNLNSFYAIHGRAAPVAQGIKIADPSLRVVVFSGDGDAYGEGLEHLIFAAKRNVDIAVIIHDNRVYGLTTGQYTPTSPEGFRGRSTPYGSKETPLNPLELLLAGGASFLARGYSNRMDGLKQLIRAAILHPGFALVEVLQVCVTFYNLYEEYNQKVYEIRDHDPNDVEQARRKIREWDYNRDSPIALGLFYQSRRPLFEESFPPAVSDRRAAIRRLLQPS